MIDDPAVVAFTGPKLTATLADVEDLIKVQQLSLAKYLSIRSGLVSR